MRQFHFGLRHIQFVAEYPHFDEYAQADVEGRERKIAYVGGIDRTAPAFWRNNITKPKG